MAVAALPPADADAWVGAGDVVFGDEDDDSEDDRGEERGDATSSRKCRGQARQVTREVEQDLEDPTVFRLRGKDKSWFLQKGGVLFDAGDPRRFRLEVQFLESCFGDEYAALSQVEQAATTNWMLMVGACRSSWALTGYRDCKESGFYFLLHLNYRRTRWRVIGCPHASALEDIAGNCYTCDPQDGGQFELPAERGQVLAVELMDGELWLMVGGERAVRWRPLPKQDGVPPGDISAEALCPAILTPNCDTSFRAVVL